MQIQLNTDRHTDGNAALQAQVSEIVEHAIGRFSDRITRLEVHIADVNSGTRSGADDMRCTLEARIAGKKPVSVTHNAATVEQAIGGAAEKLQKVLTRAVERQQATKGRPPYGGESPV